jgi:hypothetical protein
MSWEILELGRSHHKPDRPYVAIQPPLRLELNDLEQHLRFFEHLLQSVPTLVKIQPLQYQSLAFYF